MTGHSDSQKMRYKKGRAFNDNKTLSEARARSVAEYVSALLEIDMERVTVQGVGASVPIADNATAEGRAKNRRVEIDFRFSEAVGENSLEVLEGYSGINSDLDKKVFHVKDSFEENIIEEKRPEGFTNLKEGMTFSQPVF